MIEIEYTRVGDYNMPNLTMTQEKLPTGKFAQMRLHYLKKNKKGEYTILLMNNKLAEHLREIQETATKMIKQIVEKMAKQEGITEELKLEDQMTWIGMMNNYRMIAEEQIMKELIYN
ncbi:MAG: TnpV protein [Clostridia bacterium]|nr:TnpV protein [Clostridia bacterium]